MKYLIFLSIFLSFSFADARPHFDSKPNDKMTDVQSPSEYKKEVHGLSTSDFECNLYIEKAGASLYAMSIAEQNNDKKTVSSEFLIFLKNSDNAIEYCKYYSSDVVSDMIEIQEGVTFYYEKEFGKPKRH